MDTDVPLNTVRDIEKNDEISKDAPNVKDNNKNKKTYFTDLLRNLDPIEFYRQDPDQFKRTKFRLIVALFTIFAIAVIVMVVNITSHKQIKMKLSSDGPLEFDLDNCNLVFERATSDHSPFATIVDVQNHPDVTIKLAGDKKLRIENNKELYHRYTNYFCNIVMYVPLDGVLPYTTIHANGRRVSTITSTTLLQFRQSLTLSTATIRGAQLRTYLNDIQINQLFVTAQTGVLSLQNVSIQNADIQTRDMNLFLKLKNSVSLTSNVPAIRRCVTSIDPTCDQNNVTNTCDSAILPSFNGSTTFAPININCTGDCFLNLCALSDDNDAENLEPFTGDDSNIDPIIRPIGFTSDDINRLQSTFSQQPNREIIFIGIRGPGAPVGRWVWSNRLIYLIFHPTFLDVFSLYLLSPSSAVVNVTLSPSFCPGIFNGIDLDRMVDLDRLIKKTVTPPIGNSAWSNSGLESIFAFQVYSGDETGVASKTYTVDRDTGSGEYYLYSPNIGNSTRLLLILVVNIFLAVITTSYVFYIVVKKLLLWRRESLELWGNLYFGKEWDKKRDDVFHRAGFFFMLEFIVCLPNNRRGWIKSALTTWIHILSVFLIVLPILVGTLIYGRSVEYYTDSYPYLAIIIQVIILLYFLMGMIYLMLYYMDVNYKYIKFISYPFYIITLIIGYVSLFYLVNLTYWIVLGALIKPSKILPYASVIIVFIAHSIGTVSRVRKLHLQLKEEVTTAEVVKELPQENLQQVPRTATINGSLTVVDSMKLLQKSRILELRDSTIREQIVQEIAAFFILISFFTFLLIGFTTLSTNQDVSSAISSLMVFAVGGGVNIPLSYALTPEEKKKRYERRLVEEAQEEYSRIV